MKRTFLNCTIFLGLAVWVFSADASAQQTAKFTLEGSLQSTAGGSAESSMFKLTASATGQSTPPDEASSQKFILFGGYIHTLSGPPIVINSIGDEPVFVQISDSRFIDLKPVFAGEMLTYDATTGDSTIATVTTLESTLIIVPVAAGSTMITVVAKDELDRKVSDTFIVTVNRPPIVIAGIDPQGLIKGGAAFTVELAIVFIDPDSAEFGDTLTFESQSADTSVALATVISNRLIVVPVDAGTTTVCVTANDSREGLTPTSFRVTVRKPNLRVSTNSIEFDSVIVGTTKDATLTIANDGGDTTLVISNIEFAGNTAFSANPTALGVDPDRSTDVVVTFAPEAQGEKMGTLTIISNDPDDIIPVKLSGTGILGPEPVVKSVDPSFEQTGKKELCINIGGNSFRNMATLSFSSSGIIVNSVVFIGSMELEANITIAVGARVGPRDVIVTNPDGQNSGISIDTLFTVIRKGDVNFNNQIDDDDIEMILRFIFKELDPTDEQEFAADFNNDGSVSILDVILIEFEIGNRIMGDVTGDGLVNVQDLISVINIILGIGEAATEVEMVAADLNGDGMIDVSDLIAIINTILGIR